MNPANVIYEPSHTEYFEELLAGYDEFIPYHEFELDIIEQFDE